MRLFSLLLLLGAAAASAHPGHLGPHETNELPRAARTLTLRDVLKVYAVQANRTILEHPALRGMALARRPGTNDLVRPAVDELLAASYVTIIPDGDKFLLAVPVSLAHSIVPRSGQPAASTNAVAGERVLAAGMINFENVPGPNVIQFYAELSRRRLLNPEAMPGISFSLRTTTPLTQREVGYAMETVLAWHGVKIVPVDERAFKVERGQ